MLFSNSGKPIYALHGDCLDFAEQCATMSAVLGHFARKSDTLKYIRSGAFNIVLLQKTSVVLMAISKTGEPPQAIRL